MSWFICGCCGCAFQSTDDEQRKFDQDDGYGICPPCAYEIEAQNERQWMELENFVAQNMNEANREKFLSYELPLRRGLIAEMIDAGVIKFVIKPGHTQ